nr:response regulator transcription factor [Rhodococcus opacus PD630]
MTIHAQLHHALELLRSTTLTDHEARVRTESVLDGIAAAIATDASTHTPRQTPDESDCDRPPLTDREDEILTLLAGGQSNAAIGRHLYISTNTVRFHVSNILRKLSVSNRTAAAAKFRHDRSPSNRLIVDPPSTPSAAPRLASGADAAFRSAFVRGGGEQPCTRKPIPGPVVSLRPAEMSRSTSTQFSADAALRVGGSACGRTSTLASAHDRADYPE